MMLRNAILKFINNRLNTCVIFNFHDIVEDSKSIREDQLSLDSFMHQLNWIQQHFKIVRLDELLDNYTENKVDSPMAAITFDDGYRSHFDLVKPILEQLNLKATFYVSSSHLEKNCYWHDEVEVFCQKSNIEERKQLTKLLNSLGINSSSIIEAIKYQPLAIRAVVLSYIQEITRPFFSKRLLMNAAEIVELYKQGHLIGGHTLNHPILALESEATCIYEIQEDLIALEKILNATVTTFAYPNGIRERDFNSQHQNILLNYGIKYAVSTQKSIMTKNTEMMAIPRVNLFGCSEILHCNYLLRIIYKSLFSTQ